MYSALTYIGSFASVAGFVFLFFGGNLTILGVMLLIGGVPLLFGGLHLKPSGPLEKNTAHRVSGGGLLTVFTGIFMCISILPFVFLSSLLGFDGEEFELLWALFLIPIGGLTIIVGMVWIMLDRYL